MDKTKQLFGVELWKWGAILVGLFFMAGFGWAVGSGLEAMP